MGRIACGCCVVITALTVICASARAGDRKADATVASRSFTLVKAADAGTSLSGDRRSRSEPTNENEALLRGARKPVTFFRFHSRFGDVAVQPVVGVAKGAQLSIGF